MPCEKEECADGETVSGGAMGGFGSRATHEVEETALQAEEDVWERSSSDRDLGSIGKDEVVGDDTLDRQSVFVGEPRVS